MSSSGGTPVIRTESANDPLTVELHSRRLIGYPVTNAELEMLASGGGSLNAGFFGTCIGAGISLVSTLVSAKLSDRLFAVYVASTLVAFAGTVLFGVRTVFDRLRAKRLLTEIRENPSRLHAAG